MNRLRELRESKGLTRPELSKELNIPVRTIARWENGETDMFLKTAIKLAEYFDITLDKFVGK
ncbi:helix-turn-helix transcriptional regulator [Streptococcus zalophi]|uniref:helix-turn-helix transcriptional regulator n=1 Tax=Streptococcus zalophi TaxID=640031 RepID=UPI00215CE5B8|nr:helix-turn-helix transcriptional regulator [Streptococcus zalophi]MCR8968237.1 helix-turn-helix transcriptional regulator [Streptococcus zalophi]